MKSLSEILKEKYKNSDKDIVLDGADFISQKGYTLIPNYVLHTDKISAKAKLVYAMLLSYAWGNKNASFPGQEKLAEDCGLGRATIQRVLYELRDKGFITIIIRGLGKTNVYVLHFKRRSGKKTA